MLGGESAGLVGNSSVTEGFPRLQWFCTGKQRTEGVTDPGAFPPPVEDRIKKSHRLAHSTGLSPERGSDPRGRYPCSSLYFQHSHHTLSGFSRASPASCQRTQPASLGSR